MRAAFSHVSPGRVGPWATGEDLLTRPGTLAPGFERFQAHLHHVIATLRADGSPSVSGSEARIVGDQLWIGMMPGSAKLGTFFGLRRSSRTATAAASNRTTVDRARIEAVRINFYACLQFPKVD